jgi:enediyne biosynthesis protein CalE5
MATSPPDPDHTGRPPGQNFDALARGWGRWWATWERDGQPLSDRLITLARLAPGQRVLDVATGLGEPAVTAAHAVGPTGTVVAIDAAAPLLALAVARGEALGLRHLTFHQLDVARVGQLEGRFDAVLCRSGLMFFPHLGTTLRQLRGLLRPGGHFAASIWGAPERIPLMTLPQTVIRRHLAAPAAPAARGAAALDGPGLVRGLADAGFGAVRQEVVPLTFRFTAAADYIRYTRDVAPHVTASLAGVPAAEQERIWQAIGEAVQQYRAPDGAIHLPAEAICVAGRNGGA